MSCSTTPLITIQKAKRLEKQQKTGIEISPTEHVYVIALLGSLGPFVEFVCSFVRPVVGDARSGLLALWPSFGSLGSFVEFVPWVRSFGGGGVGDGGFGLLAFWPSVGALGSFVRRWWCGRWEVWPFSLLAFWPSVGSVDSFVGGGSVRSSSLLDFWPSVGSLGSLVRWQRGSPDRLRPTAPVVT